MPKHAPSNQLELWRRHTLFVVSLLLMAAGLLLGFRSDSATTEFAQGVCLKVGIVLFVLWLALPQLEKLNFWSVVPVVAVTVLVILRPQLLRVAAQVIVPMAPVLFLLWLFWNPKKQRSSRHG